MLLENKNDSGSSASNASVLNISQGAPLAPIQAQIVVHDVLETEGLFI